MDVRAEVKVIIKNGSEFLMGPGVFALLNAIAENSSVSEAAKSINVSYSKAWKMIREAEEGAGEALVIRSTGGKGGGQASLTEAANKLLKSYEVTCEEIRLSAKKIAEKNFSNNQPQAK